MSRISSGGCSSLVPSHHVSSGNGNLTVTLTQAGASRMTVQVCHPTAVNHALECTIPPFATLAVGQSTSAAIKGGREQVVTIFPEGCGAPNTPLSDPISYTVSVEHPG